jgi:hypothetical protein
MPVAVGAEGVFPSAEVNGAVAEFPENVRELLPPGLAPTPMNCTS